MIKKRLLIVNDLLRGGGVEKLMLDLTLAWHDKYDITICTDEYDAEFCNIYPENVKYCQQKSKFLFNKFGKIDKILNYFLNRFKAIKNKRVFTGKNFDIVIAIKEGFKPMDVVSMPIPRKFMWVHTDYSNYYYTYDMYQGQANELKVMQQFEKVVCVADRVKQGIIDVLGDPGNLVVKYNPLESGEIFEKAREEVVDLEPKQSGVPRFVTVGRINYQKGFDLLLEACHMLERDGFLFEIIVVGGKEAWGDEYYKLERAKKRLGVNCLQFIGARRNPYKYINDADWFISSSLFEGYSYVSQEAALLDKPMMLTDVSGVRELLGDSEYGLVVEPSVIGIYEGLKSIILNPELKEYYTQRIKERKSIITYKERIDEIEKLLI